MPKSHTVVTPEERELEKKRAELAALETELADRELEYATLQNELRVFERRYFGAVGSLYAELDDLEAQIAEARARQNPGQPRLCQQAEDARAKAAETAQAVNTIVDTPTERFTPSDELKRLYREIARTVHPDLSVTDSDRARRTRAMAEANRAYAAGDEARLRAILENWHSSPDAVEGEGIAAELVRIIRKIHQVERRLEEIRATTTELHASELYRLLGNVNAATAEGRDLLAEMADQLKSEIADERARLATFISHRSAAV